MHVLRYVLYLYQNIYNSSVRSKKVFCCLRALPCLWGLKPLGGVSTQPLTAVPEPCWKCVCWQLHMFLCTSTHTCTQVFSHQWCCLLICPQDKRPRLTDLVPHTLAQSLHKGNILEHVYHHMKHRWENAEPYCIPLKSVQPALSAFDDGYIGDDVKKKKRCLQFGFLLSEKLYLYCKISDCQTTYNTPIESVHITYSSDSEIYLRCALMMVVRASWLHWKTQTALMSIQWWLLLTNHHRFSYYCSKSRKSEFYINLARPVMADLW